MPQTKNLKILNAKTQDAEEILNVLKQTWLSTYPNDKNNISHEDIIKFYANEKERIKKIKTRIQENDGSLIILVAKINKKIIGYARASKTKNYIFAIYVLPTHHGQGIGKALLEKLLEHLTPKETSLEVSTYNQKAIKFYEKFGFKIIPNSKNTFKITENKSIPIIKMKKCQ